MLKKLVYDMCVHIPSSPEWRACSLHHAHKRQKIRDSQTFVYILYYTHELCVYTTIPIIIEGHETAFYGF